MKEKLDLYKACCSQEEYGKRIIKEMKTKLDEYNFAENYSYMFSYFSDIKKSLSGIIEEYKFSEAEDDLNELLKKGIDLLKHKPGQIKKTSKGFKDLKCIVDNLESISMALELDFLDAYTGNSSDFVRYLLCDKRSYQINEIVLKNYPYQLKTVDSNGKDILSYVVDKYLLNINNRNDILYYDNLIEKIMADPERYKLETLEKELERLQEFRKEYDYNIENNNWTEYWIDLLEDRLSRKVRTINKEEYAFRTGTELEPSFPVKHAIKRTFKNEKEFLNEFKRADKNRLYITIDNKGAIDKDDALSIQKYNGCYILGVHITSPMDYITINSPIFLDAWSKTSSVYKGNQAVINMLPQGFGSKLSLDKYQKKLVTSFYTFVNETDGKIEDFIIEKEVIKVNEQFTPYEIGDLISGGGSDKISKELLETLVNLNDVSDLLRLNRTFDDTLYSEYKQNSLSVSGNRVDSVSAGGKIVESSMYTTNHLTAKKAHDLKIPFIYRNLELNEKVKEIYDFFVEHYGHIPDEHAEKMLKQFQSTNPDAQYSHECKGHQGLKIDEYCHITSPMRRLSDLVAMDCLNKFYFNKEANDKQFVLQEELVKSAAKHIDERKLVLERIYHDNAF